MPYSGVYPFYAQHIMTGLLCAVSEINLKASDFEFVPVYTGQGSVQATLEAAQKLVFFEGVDLLIGMVNIKALDELRPILENHQKIGLFFDFGELVPRIEGFGNHIFNISAKLWQSQYALGQWAVKEFGANGQMVSPIYEAGFNLNTSFLQGAASSGTDSLRSFVLPEALANKDVLNLESFFKAIDIETPAFVHAIFTGKMGNQFLAQWRNSKFYDAIPLLTVENMAYSDMLEDVQDLNLKFYSSSLWQKTSQTKENLAFVKNFENLGKQQANIFGMMGYEAGLVLSNISSLIRKGDVQGAIQVLKTKDIIGPRGTLNLQTQSAQQFSLVDINKIITNKNTINQTVLNQSTAIGFDTSTVFQDTLSGWQNPYLSI